MQIPRETDAVVIARPGPAEGLELRRMPLPPVGPHDLLVEVAAAGINRADVLQRQGMYRLPAGMPVELAAIPGLEIAGTVIAASDGGGETGERFALANVDDLHTTPGLITLRSGDETYRAAIRQSPLTGWTLIAWAPVSVISQPLMDAVWSLAVGGLLLAAIVVLVVYWVTLQIGRSVRGLENDAKRLGTGQPVTAKYYPISEIATVSSALEEASKRRQQAEVEVRFLMRELAHRSKNQMTVIAAMAKQTARGADSVPEFVQSFEPGETWFWDYETDDYYDGPRLPDPQSRPDDQTVPGPRDRVPADWRSQVH